MAEVEPVPVKMCIAMHRLNDELTEDELTNFASSLISGTPIEEKMINYKIKTTKQSREEIKEKGVLGHSYYKSFMNRHREEIDSKYPRPIAWNRQEWETFENMKLCHERICLAMKSAKVAIELDEPVFVNKDGEVFHQSRKSQVLVSSSTFLQGLPNGTSI